MTQAATAAPTRPLPRFAEFVTLMAALMALTALSIDVMLPALPQMRAEFGIADANRQQLVLTSYVVGFAIGQLFHGPAERLARPQAGAPRRPRRLSRSPPSAASSPHSFDALLAARFLQGLANAAPRVVAVAVVRDTYGGRRMAEVMSFVMMVFIVVPVVAPTHRQRLPPLRQLAPDLRLPLRLRARRPRLVGAAPARDPSRRRPRADDPRLGRPRLRPGDDHAADLRLHARHRRHLRLAHGLHQLGAADLRRGLRRRRLVPRPLRLRRRDARASPPSSTAASS